MRSFEVYFWLRFFFDAVPVVVTGMGFRGGPWEPDIRPSIYFTRQSQVLSDLT